MSDNDSDDAPRQRLPPSLHGDTSRTGLTGSSRARISFSSLTHSLQETISRRNINSSGSRSGSDPLSSDPLPSRPSVSPYTLSRRRFVNSSPNRGSMAGKRFRSILGRPSTPLYASGSSKSSEFESAATVTRGSDHRRVTYRRYRVGDTCLVECRNSRIAKLVNRYGFPAGSGFTPEEQRGPYLYVLATVTNVHFEEDAEYYTVRRADTQNDQRADADVMVPIKSNSRAEAAALDAATALRRDATAEDGGERASASIERIESGVAKGLERCLVTSIAPFLQICTILQKSVAVLRRQGKKFLYGEKPYKLSFRVTAVNICVFCNAWVMFIDQLRLAFFPPSADYPLAIISCIFWCILVSELVFEVFIRPDGYRQLIESEHAYNPDTVWYIHTFHLVIESVALFAFIPEFACLFSNLTCGDRPEFSLFNAARITVLGPDRLDTFYGWAFFALVRLRVVGLVRHWRNMWTTNTFVHPKTKENGFLMPTLRSSRREAHIKDVQKEVVDQKKKDAALVNAYHIGTALMVVNSHRAMTVFWFVFGLYPLIFCFASKGGSNPLSSEMVELLQANNLQFTTQGDQETCDFYLQSVISWAFGVTTGSAPKIHSESDVYLLYLQISPTVRCPTNSSNRTEVLTIDVCNILMQSNQTLTESIIEYCYIWGWPNKSTSDDALAERAGIRTGAITQEIEAAFANFTYANGTVVTTQYRVEAKFNTTFSVEPAALGSFLLQLALLLYILGFLSILRKDARLLVLGPLRNMLKIVARYAKNPLVTIKAKSSKGDDSETDDDATSSSDDDDASQDRNLGSFETEQLINAVSKITDLLRKCWGVAGAGIISTNLSRREGSLTEVFNPTVPGKSVYALFAFCAVNAFDHYLRSLGGDIMILINDVASVLHSEVYRWGLGDSGQCNKNLGSAWLMVFRIGNVKDVVKRLDEATNVVFSNTQKARTNEHQGVARRRRGGVGNDPDSHIIRKPKARKLKRHKSANAMSLSLAQLPGISVFTDRALIGILKTFAGIYRDDKLLNWKKDFRLGAGVGAFSVNMIFGMDAGWAVEGAVGSEYKIDATYLSPHVNMASRMMSACKQYGVSVLLSQAVQQLLSESARSKLRHLDTVTVKGSSLKQRIYTYDARHKGVDFFLFGKTDEQADFDSDRYTSDLWNTDQDLTSMRQHVTDDFLEEFDRGRHEYLTGHWPSAMKHLESANEILLQNMVEQGYFEYELNELQNHVLDGADAKLAEQEFRNETEDGPSRRLLAYMRSEGGVAPANWEGYRPLTSK